jgi:GntR family transcriptional regulator
MTTQPALSPTDETSPALDIYRQFRGLIASGQIGAGERLPTVRQTASDLNVAPGTAAKAYKLLERDGLVVTRTAAGTRVAESAAVLPGAVVRRIRDLVAEADAAGAPPEDVIAVLRVVWQTPTRVNAEPKGGEA